MTAFGLSHSLICSKKTTTLKYTIIKGRVALHVLLLYTYLLQHKAIKDTTILFKYALFVYLCTRKIHR